MMMKENIICLDKKHKTLQTVLKKYLKKLSFVLGSATLSDLTPFIKPNTTCNLSITTESIPIYFKNLLQNRKEFESICSGLYCLKLALILRGCLRGEYYISEIKV